MTLLDLKFGRPSIVSIDMNLLPSDRVISSQKAYLLDLERFHRPQIRIFEQPEFSTVAWTFADTVHLSNLPKKPKPAQD